MLVLALAAQAAAPPPAEPTDGQDVVVVGERLKGWSGKVSYTLGVQRCATTRSTGDRAIDRIGCRVLTDCFVQRQPRISAAAKDAGGDAERRRALMAPIYTDMKECLIARRAALVAELVGSRRRKAGS